MPLPRVRFTVRRLMVAVAVFAVASVWWVEKSKERRVEFTHIHYEHVMQSSKPNDFHARMAAKYKWAAHHPWFPVWPDPF